MIGAWMVYGLAITLVICVAAWAAELALYLARRPTRWAWGAAVLLAFLLPVAALLRPQQFASIRVPLAAATSSAHGNSTAAGRVIAVAAAPHSTQRLTWADLDGPLGWGWGAASAALLLALVGGAARLARLRRQWQPMKFHGRDVLVAEDIGPAVVGLWPPEVVIPAWALALTDDQKRLMLSHEAEHVRSRDPWLLAAGMSALIAAPWNPALWWLVHRLRHAVEMDCDARVMRAGHGPLAYGELLLRVGQRRARLPVAALAFGEPRSLLELRIRRLSARLPRRRWLGAGAAAFATAVTIVAACETPRPVSPQEAGRVDSPPEAIALRVRTVVDSLDDLWMRPWIQQNLERYYPDLLRQPSGPPVDVWFGHDAQLRVVDVARTAVGASGPVESKQIQAVFNRFRPGDDGWGVADRRTLKGLVRDNVRVISVHLSEDSSRGGNSTGGFGQNGPDVEYLRLLAREYHPEVFTHPSTHAAVALVFDAQHRVIAHATGVREPGDHSCDDVVRRLVPAFANAQWSSSGCAGAGEPAEAVIVYWRSLR